MDTVQIDFLNIDQQWDKKIKHCHFDIYHLSGWVAASAIVDKGTPMGLMATYKNKQLFFAHYHPQNRLGILGCNHHLRLWWPTDGQIA